MNDANERFGRNPDRRRFLRRAAGVAALAAVGATARRAAADPALDALMGDGQHGEFGQSFDQSSRTIRMPKATAPTLSPQTADFTEQAVKTYDGIVARGGWPQVPKIDELQLGNAPSERRRSAPRGLPSRAISTPTRSATTSTIPMSRLRCGGSRRAMA